MTRRNLSNQGTIPEAILNCNKSLTLYTQLRNTSETFEKFLSHLHISDELSTQDKERIWCMCPPLVVLFVPKSIKMEATANIFWLILMTGKVPILYTYSTKLKKTRQAKLKIAFKDQMTKH